MTHSSEKCKMLVRIWNMQRSCWDIFQVEVPGRPQKGPQDEYLKVCRTYVEPDNDGNFINHDYSDLELDAVHAFAITRLTIEFWERCSNKKISWPWSLSFFKRRLLIDLNDPLDAGQFKRNERAIIFNEYYRKRLYFLSHETTHAIIQGFRKDINCDGSRSQKAIEEALCDLSPIFLLFSIARLLIGPIKSIPDNLEKHDDMTSELAAQLMQNNGGSDRISEMNLVRDNYYMKGDEIVNVVFYKIIELWNKSANWKQFEHSLYKIGAMTIAPILKINNLNVDKYLKELHIL